MDDNKLIIRSASDLAELVPHIVGFNPSESLVAVVMQDDRVVVTARADLSDMDAIGGVEALMAQIRDRFPRAEVALMAYTEDDHVVGWDVIDRAAAAWPVGGVRGSMIVDGDRWMSSDGDGGRIDAAGPLAVAATVAGMDRRPSREDLVHELDSAQATPEVLTLIDSADAAAGAVAASKNAARLGELIERNAGQRPSLAEAIEMAVLTSGPLLEVALVSMTDAPAAEAHLATWTGVVQQVPESLAAGPLTAAGVSAWIGGAGAILTIAADRLERLGSRSRMLDGLINGVISPDACPEIRSAILQASRWGTREAGNDNPPMIGQSAVGGGILGGPDGAPKTWEEVKADPVQPEVSKSRPSQRPGLGY